MKTRKSPTFSVGDRIAYSAKFLRSTGQQSGNAGAMRATVTAVGAVCSPSAGAIISFVTDNGLKSGGLACNFTLVSRIGIDAALAN